MNISAASCADMAARPVSRGPGGRNMKLTSLPPPSPSDTSSIVVTWTRLESIPIALDTSDEKTRLKSAGSAFGVNVRWMESSSAKFDTAPTFRPVEEEEDDKVEEMSMELDDEDDDEDDEAGDGAVDEEEEGGLAGAVDDGASAVDEWTSAVDDGGDGAAVEDGWSSAVDDTGC